MATYGIDVYGKTLYGTTRDLDYHVTNLTAVQSDYGRITLSWDTPPLADWTTLTLVRSGYGYPVAVTDGVTLASFPVTALRGDFSDSGLPPGYWYYTFFLATPFPAWSASLTYATGDRVSFSGQVYSCLAPYSLNVTPGTNPAVWGTSFETTLYRAAGSVACMSVRDYGYTAVLDSLIPAPYKALPGTSTDVADANGDLAAFLAIVGFGFGQMHTELDDLLEVDDILTTRQDRLYELGLGLGLSPELASSARYQRLRTQRAALLNQETGTAQGIVDAVHAATGLSATVATGVNLMLTQDQSAFASPIPMPWDPAGAYKPGDQVLYLGVRYQCVGLDTVITPATYVAAGVTGAPNALATTTISATTYVKETAASASSITVPFTLAANGVYYLTFAAASGPDYGVVTVTVDGNPVLISHSSSTGPIWSGGAIGSVPAASLDLYTASAAAYGAISTPQQSLGVGSHTMVISALTKNGSSTGFAIAFSSLTIFGNPAVYPPGTPPTGATGSALQWSTTALFFDTTTYFNPVTGSIGTWSPVGGPVVNLGTQYLGG